MNEKKKSLNETGCNTAEECRKEFNYSHRIFETMREDRQTLDEQEARISIRMKATLVRVATIDSLVATAIHRGQAPTRLNRARASFQYIPLGHLRLGCGHGFVVSLSQRRNIACFSDS